MLIIITLPDFIEGEARMIADFLDRGDIDLVHIRKPRSMVSELESLIRNIPASCYSRLVLHDYHFLAQKYGLYGIHLNSRNPLPFEGWNGSISRSCHSFDEVEKYKHFCNYVSLSPIFNSISKIGYFSAFSSDQILQAYKDGIIDHKVLALGGVTFDKIPDVYHMGFGGAMILGDAWKNI